MEESTLGLLPNPFEKQGVKFAITYIGEVLGNPTGGQKQSAVYEDRINFAVDVESKSLSGLRTSPSTPTSSRSMAAGSRAAIS